MERGVTPRRLRIANLSVVDHSPHLERFAEQGYAVDGPPNGLVVPTGLQPDHVRSLAQEAVLRARALGYDGAVIGGRADVVCYLRDQLIEAGLSCYSADTARILDREGYFVQMPIGLIEILPRSEKAK